MRHVEKVLNDDPAQNDADSDDYYRRRIHWALGVLVQYAEALGTARAQGNMSFEEFPFGM